MKIIQVATHLHIKASGPSYSVPRLCESLVAQGATVELHVPLPESESTPNGYIRRGYEINPWAGPLLVSRDMRIALRAAASAADVVHNHGLWFMPNYYAEFVTRGKPCKFVTSPRGYLSTWALQASPWRKRLAWILGQNKVLHNAACIHATALSEYSDIRRLGISVPVAIIPNGVDMPPLQERTQFRHRNKKLLFLGRIHPKKGVDVLLRAWSKVQDINSDWDLEIAGPDNEGYLSKMTRLSKDLCCKRVNFSGPIHGLEKLNTYQSSDLFVLPTHSENFGMTVAESLACGTPVIVTKGAPWSDVSRIGCGWWIDHGEESLVNCLRQALRVEPDMLRSMGLRGRQWVQAEFSWDRMARMMIETYSWMACGSDMPECVVRY